MKELIIEKLNERVYTTTLKNGFKIILYPTEKSKNFYITLTTRYGAKVTSYKKGNKIHKVIPGTAHFLEHKVMNLNDNKIGVELEKLGTMPNAYTNYYGTTYNLYGQVDITKNIDLLFNRVFTFNLSDKSVENEKSIINQEIDMNKDSTNVIINDKINKNLFFEEYVTNTVLGEKEDIRKITKEYLYDIYNTFYTLDNMFCVITGNFNKEEVLDSIINNVNNIKTNKSDVEIIKVKEPEHVKINYEEVETNVVHKKACISYKIPLKLFKGYKNELCIRYLFILLNILFSETSEFTNNLKEREIINKNISYVVRRVGEYFVIKILAGECNDVNSFLKEVEGELVNLNVLENDFNRKKKVSLSASILSYEDIENINDNLVLDNLEFNKVRTSICKDIEALNYKEFKDIINKLDFSNKAIVVLHK